MADSFTADHIQGIFGRFTAVLDYATNDPTVDNTQGLFGQFRPVLDEAGAAAAAGGRIMSSIAGAGGLAAAGGIAGKGGGLAA